MGKGGRHLKEINSLIKLSWTKVKVLGALLGMTFVYIAALTAVCLALRLNSLWLSVIIIFSFGLLIAAIYGMKIKTKLPGGTDIDIESERTPAAWEQFKSSNQEHTAVANDISNEEIKKKLSENKDLGMPKFLARTDNKTGQLTGVITEHDIMLGNKGTEVSPEDKTVVHINRSPYKEAQRISKLSPNLWKDYLPLVDAEGKPVGTVSRIKLVDTLQRPYLSKLPLEIEF